MISDHQIELALCNAVEYAKKYIGEGRVVNYIPELAYEDPTQIGVSIRTVEGKTFQCGAYDREFTMQSISKTISLIYALKNVGYDKVFSKVGVEPTGDAFNSMVKLEIKDTRPLNPMINAGAIAVASCGLDVPHAFDEFLAFTRKLCGRNDININEAVYLSEKQTGMRNRAMAYMMQSDNILEHDAEDVLDFYFRMCSISVTTKDLAHYAAILANHGIDPDSKECLVDRWIVQIVKTLMFTCGMYDASGEFAVKVGIPAKSGVGGGIIGSVENKMGIAAFGPALDQKGNSIGASHIFNYLSEHLNLHCFT